MRGKRNRNGKARQPRPSGAWSRAPEAGNVSFDFRTHLQAQRRRKLARSLVGAAAVFVIVFAGGMAATNWNTVATAAAPVLANATQPRFSLCSGPVRRTCVVDGDTFWLRGEKIRVADIDTPEVSEPKCPAEYEAGMRATYRLRDLLNAGPFELEPVGDRDRDKYGRLLRVVVRDGRSLGDQLVSEGHARTWTGRREPWC
jgi:micrococcal nuclease